MSFTYCSYVQFNINNFGIILMAAILVIMRLSQKCKTIHSKSDSLVLVIVILIIYSRKYYSDWILIVPEIVFFFKVINLDFGSS